MRAWRVPRRWAPHLAAQADDPHRCGGLDRGARRVLEPRQVPLDLRPGDEFRLDLPADGNDIGPLADERDRLIARQPDPRVVRERGGALADLQHAGGLERRKLSRVGGEEQGVRAHGVGVRHRIEPPAVPT